jgi:hypothetical protein
VSCPDLTRLLFHAEFHDLVAQMDDSGITTLVTGELFGKDIHVALVVGDHLFADKGITLNDRIN